jgi:hypothetical protein
LFTNSSECDTIFLDDAHEKEEKMKIVDLEALLTLAKASGCTEITFWRENGQRYDVDQTDTHYPLHDIASHVSPRIPHIYSIPLDRTDRDGEI